MSPGDTRKGNVPAPTVILQQGEDRRLAVVAFSGGLQKMFTERPFDFMDLTGSLKYSRILLRERATTWYLSGFSDQCDDFDGVIGLLRKHLHTLAPDKVMIVGTSSGGYAALLAGHLLRADYVHSFAPQTYLDPASIRRHHDNNMVQRSSVTLRALYARYGEDGAYLDLARALAEWNGRTRYLLHVCGGRELDVRRALHLEHVPALTILRYPCTVHNVLVGMSYQRFVRSVLSLEQQDDLVNRHQALFGDGTRQQPRGNLGEKWKERIAAIVHRIGRERLAPGEIHRCRNLVVRLGLDSMDCLELMLGLETEFGVEIDPEEVMLEDFRTVASIGALVWGAASASSSTR